MFALMDVLMDISRLFPKRVRVPPWAVRSIPSRWGMGDFTATAFETLCVEIIENNQKLIAEYNDVLVQMLNLMGV